MTTEQYQIGYEAGYQAGFDEALAQQEPNPWQDAVIDQLVVHHIYQAAHDTDPRKAINDLLCISNDIALDPRVSSYAQALIDRGRREAQQEQPSTPKVVLELPEGDTRTVKVRWSEWRGNVLHICIIVEQGGQHDKDCNNLDEAIDAMKGKT